jgi:MFS family permease
LEKPSLRAMPRNVWILGLAALLTDISSEMIHGVLPLFLVSVLGTSVTTVGLIEGIAESIASITKLVSGAWSDRLGKRKPLVVGGYGLSALVKPLFCLAPNFLWVLAARGGDRIGKGIRGAPRDAVMADSVEPEIRGAAFGLRQSLDTVGACLGPALAVALMAQSQDNYRYVFFAALLPAVMAVRMQLQLIHSERFRIAFPGCAF